MEQINQAGVMSERQENKESAREKKGTREQSDGWEQNLDTKIPLPENNKNCNMKARTKIISKKAIPL